MQPQRHLRVPRYLPQSKSGTLGEGCAYPFVRISSPPIAHPRHYGIDTPIRRDLIASSHSAEEIAEYLRVDSLAYLSVDGLMQSVRTTRGFCQACFTGKYPVEFEGEGKDVFEVRGRRA